MTKEELKKKKELERVINQSFKYQEQKKEERNRDMIENQMDWIKNNLSPTGGKKPFRKTQKEQMTKKPRGSWLTKDE